MCGSRRRATVVGLLWMAALCAACEARSTSSSTVTWSDALARWERREPGAWQAWRTVAAAGELEASERLIDADRDYRAGIVALEHGDADAPALLQRGAERGPIDPALYLPLARACRTRGAGERAADFYRKALAESADPEVIGAARREMSQLGLQIGDPFSAHDDPRSRYAAMAGLAALAIVLGFWTRARRRYPHIEELLKQHPERTISFRYACGVLRHEVLKHRLIPLRSGTGGSPAPTDPLGTAWRRHLDALAAALGVPTSLLLRHPSFAAAERAMRTLVEVERAGGVARPATLTELAHFDDELGAWAQLGDRCAIDAALLHRMIESLRDERPGRRLPVSIELEEPTRPLWVSAFANDLLLVLRNLTRNAVSAAESVSASSIHLDTDLFLDETGQEWVRVAIHDPSPTRPPSERALDRGLGLVRATLERYGGALVEGAPRSGYAKALCVSLPYLETEQVETASRKAA